MAIRTALVKQGAGSAAHAEIIGQAGTVEANLARTEPSNCVGSTPRDDTGKPWGYSKTVFAFAAVQACLSNDPGLDHVSAIFGLPLSQNLFGGAIHLDKLASVEVLIAFGRRATTPLPLLTASFPWAATPT